MDPRGAIRATRATCAIPEVSPIWAWTPWGRAKSTTERLARVRRVPIRCRAALTKAPRLGGRFAISIGTLRATRHHKLTCCGTGFYQDQVAYKNWSATVKELGTQVSL